MRDQNRGRHDPLRPRSEGPASRVRVLSYQWRADVADHEFRLVRVPGTEGTSYLSGADPRVSTRPSRRRNLTTDKPA
jgi:hypothetical protein